MQNIPRSSTAGVFYFMEQYLNIGITHHTPAVEFANDQLDIPGKGIDGKEDPIGVKMCVYRLWYLKKYIVWYGQTLWGSYYHFKRGLIGFRPEKNVFHARIYTYMHENIKDARFKMRVELLFEADSATGLLIAMTDALEMAKGDPDCLNGEFTTYIPGWIPEDARTRFKEYVAKNTQNEAKAI